jgi:hypothetical protein
MMFTDFIAYAGSFFLMVGGAIYLTEFAVHLIEGERPKMLDLSSPPRQPPASTQRPSIKQVAQAKRA